MSMHTYMHISYAPSCVLPVPAPYTLTPPLLLPPDHQGKLRKLRAKEQRAQANKLLEEEGTLVRKTPAEFEAMRVARKVFGPSE
jgi:hypothetical protein